MIFSHLIVKKLNQNLKPNLIKIFLIDAINVRISEKTAQNASERQQQFAAEMHFDLYSNRIGKKILSNSLFHTHGWALLIKLSTAQSITNSSMLFLTLTFVMY